MQKLYIVCGLQGTGKTTFAQALSSKINVVCLFKDSLKEGLYDYRNCSTLEESRELGREAIHLLFKLAEEQLAHGVDLIIESPFYFKEDYAMFRKWEEKYNLTIYSILCSIDPKVRIQRFQNRERHASHHDTDRELNIHIPTDVYKDLPGKLIEIQSDKPVDELMERVLVLTR